jgi:hypothetical protein
MVLKAVLGDRATRIGDWANTISTIMLAVIVLALVAAQFGTILPMLWESWPIVFAFAAGSLLIGHVVGGPDPRERTALAIATVTRHPALCSSLPHRAFRLRFADSLVDHQRHDMSVRMSPGTSAAWLRCRAHLFRRDRPLGQDLTEGFPLGLPAALAATANSLVKPSPDFAVAKRKGSSRSCSHGSLASGASVSRRRRRPGPAVPMFPPAGSIAMSAAWCSDVNQPRHRLDVLPSSTCVAVRRRGLDRDRGTDGSTATTSTVAVSPAICAPGFTPGVREAVAESPGLFDASPGLRT